MYFSAVENIDKAKGKVFNIGGTMENSLSLIELFALLEREMGIEMQYKQLPWRESDQKVFVADISKVTKKLGWRPEVDKILGIKKIIDWIYSLAK
ncbi:uncharacterized protein METZ01_LOCUS280133 [marine metagenome]|uniref:NAD(P)-binding domain-containing protein n=1 Tax=marine metagenome TaxID=408172 RepID=A0A382KSK7_9ZZZZ